MRFMNDNGAIEPVQIRVLSSSDQEPMLHMLDGCFSSSQHGVSLFFGSFPVPMSKSILSCTITVLKIIIVDAGKYSLLQCAKLVAPSHM